MTLFLNHDLGPVSVGWWLGISGIKEKRTRIRNKKKKKRMREREMEGMWADGALWRRRLYKHLPKWV